MGVKSRLGEKLAYIHRHWDGLQTFLHDGRVEIDSNSVENMIRPIALNRKNALFAGHDEGGKAWGRIASLIETAKINGVEGHTAVYGMIAVGRVDMDEAKERIAFPDTGSITYSPHWIALKQGAGCNMDNAMVATKFRAFCAEREVKLNARNIEKLFSDFCAKVGRV